MSADAINLHGLFAASKPQDRLVAWHQDRYYRFDDFSKAVSYWAGRFKAEPDERYALYSESAYPFAVILTALLQAGKEAWIPGNNRPGTAQELQQFGCRLIGDWTGNIPFDYQLDVITDAINTLSDIDSTTCRFVLFTSGSTGEPKPVTKHLKQLEAEIAVLEQCWGARLMKAEVFSTVSHQHIYGLLFRVLWPLAAGRCFHSAIYLNPEQLAKNMNGKPACWIASPAHLKRLDEASPWQALARLTAIFSSGSALDVFARQQIEQSCRQQVIEIYGSTETGGIAWKDQDSGWTLFSGLTLRINNGQSRLISPYLAEDSMYPLEDRITMLADGRFTLNGRADRIVKIEEKRLSLMELEQRLTENPQVQAAHSFVITQGRDRVSVAVELTESGWRALAEQGRKPIITDLRATLQPWFEAVLMPKKWLFINKMPLTAEGKIDQHLLRSLLSTDKKKLPVVQSYETTENAVRLGIHVPNTHELIYFPDHFAGYPILPGVVQLAWVEYFGKLFFGVGNADKPFSHLEVIKFLKVIRPGLELVLALNWQETSGEVQFNFSGASETYSSGRMVYHA